MRNDLAGKRFGKLLAIRIVGKSTSGHTVWLCRCDCGSEKNIVRGNLLRAGSCGCVWRARIAKGNIKHGLYYSPEYRVWGSMMERCFNTTTKAFKNYGGRGITVCPEWRKFTRFYFDMAPKPKGMMLERINNDLGYCRENCTWASRSTQNRNTRRTRMFTVGGITMCLTDWALACGINYGTLRSRLDRGIAFEDAISDETQRLKKLSEHLKLDEEAKGR